MNKLKKVVLEVEVGDAFECINKSEYFTKGRFYRVQSSSYDIGSSSTEVEFLDDDCDLHFSTEKFLKANFKKQQIVKKLFNKCKDELIFIFKLLIMGAIALLVAFLIK